MKTLTIEAYEHQDLIKPENKGVLEKVLKKNHDLAFKDYLNGFLKSINGKTTEKLYFDTDRGNFASFTWNIRLDEILEVDFEKLKENFPSFSEEIEQLEDISKIDSRLNKLANNGVHILGLIRHGNRTAIIDSEIDGIDEDTTPLLYKKASYVANELESFCKNLSESVLKVLKEEVDYMFSEKAILDCIEANEYIFNEKGEML